MVAIKKSLAGGTATHTNMASGAAPPTIWNDKELIPPDGVTILGYLEEIWGQVLWMVILDEATLSTRNPTIDQLQSFALVVTKNEEELGEYKYTWLHAPCLPVFYISR